MVAFKKHSRWNVFHGLKKICVKMIFLVIFFLSIGLMLIYFAIKGPSSQSYGFSSSHVRMWELDYKEADCRRIDAFELWCWRRLFESPLDCKEIQPVHPKGNQSWTFIGRTGAEPETPVLWPPDVKNWLIGKDPDAGEDWRQEEKGITEDETVGWHHWLNGHEFE